MSLVKKGI